VTRDAYEKAMLPARKDLLRAVLVAYRREVVVCYGKAHWAHYQDLFDDVSWRDVGPHRVGEAAGLRIVLTTHFSGRDLNTDMQLSEFATVAVHPTRDRQS
jgi:hypothetical protein